MRLLTHNMLQCHVKNCTSNNFPLRIQEAVVEQVETTYNPEFLKNMLCRIDWTALYETAISLGMTELPEQQPEEMKDDQLKALHKVLMEVKIKEGQMVCEGCGHVYPIKDGIANMLLQDSEV